MLIDAKTSPQTVGEWTYSMNCHSDEDSEQFSSWYIEIDVSYSPDNHKREPQPTSTPAPTPTPTPTPKPTPKPEKKYTNNEIEDMAVEALVYSLYTDAKDSVGRYIKDLWNIELSLTRYGIGSIQNNGTNKWTVNGTLVFCDKYGNAKGTGNFTSYIDADGYSFCNVSNVKFS